MESVAPIRVMEKADFRFIDYRIEKTKFDRVLVIHTAQTPHPNRILLVPTLQ
jgi:hypothetical protein